MSLGRTKLGAVPYAVEAGHATSADTAGGTLAGQLVPAGMIGMFSAACPSGWISCDGSGACPNLNGAYIKGGSAFVAQTGSNTHGHTVASFSTGPAGGHTPTTASVTVNPSGSHSHVAQLEFTSNLITERAVNTFTHRSTSGGALTNISVPPFIANYQIQAAANWTNSSQGPWTSGPLTTTVPDHSHTATITMSAVPDHTHMGSMAVPAVNHEPLHATLVFCMKQ